MDLKKVFFLSLFLYKLLRFAHFDTRHEVWDTQCWETVVTNKENMIIPFMFEKKEILGNNVFTLFLGKYIFIWKILWTHTCTLTYIN